MYRLNGSEVYTTVTVSDTTNEYRLIEGMYYSSIARVLPDFLGLNIL